MRFLSVFGATLTLLVYTQAIEVSIQEATCKSLSFTITADGEEHSSGEISRGTITIGDQAVHIKLPSLMADRIDEQGNYQSEVQVDLEKDFSIAGGDYELVLELMESAESDVAVASTTAPVICDAQVASSTMTQDDSTTSVVAVPYQTASFINEVTVTEQASTVTSQKTGLPTSGATVSSPTATSTPDSDNTNSDGEGSHPSYNGDDEDAEEDKSEQATRTAGISAGVLGFALWVVVAGIAWLYAKRRRQARQEDAMSLLPFDRDGYKVVHTPQAMRQI